MRHSAPREFVSLVLGLLLAPASGFVRPASTEFALLHSAQYAPYYPAALYVPPAPSCRVTQVNILQRHGARYPTDSAGERYEAAIARLRELPAVGRLAFLTNYTYQLGIDNLLPYGFKESYKSGKVQRERYFEVGGHQDIFLRAAGSERVIQSAQAFANVFLGIKNDTVSAILVIDESPTSNNTLETECPNLDGGSQEQDEWLATYAPNVIARLSGNATDSPLLADDIAAFAQLCAFETLASTDGSRSAFCDFFEEDEWYKIEYYGDLGKFYDAGPGTRLAASKGVGYVNELLARLTGDLEYVAQDRTSVNHTLDASNATFPLDRSFYADFSHDNQMAAIATLLDLFPRGAPLPPAGPEPGRDWVFSHIAPFAGRFVFERLECAVMADEQFIRILANDKVVHLGHWCDGALADGRCLLSSFIRAIKPFLATATEEFAQCSQ